MITPGYRGIIKWIKDRMIQEVYYRIGQEIAGNLTSAGAGGSAGGNETLPISSGGGGMAIANETLTGSNVTVLNGQ
jgi:hypothetical protein